MDLNRILTNKQQDFLLGERRRINLLVGAVRSGKTYISVIAFALFVAESPKGSEFLMVGKTLTTLKRNVLNLLQTLVGKRNFVYSTYSKEGSLFGRKVYLEGAGDERGEQKIRGITLKGAYCDEATLFPESFFVMLLSRLSVSGAQLYGTCNPDDPEHYLKKKYIDNPELNISTWDFSIYDNTTLDEEFIENLVKEYSGVFYDRFILGKWVRAEGLIFPIFANDKERFLIDTIDPNELVEVTFGVDFGGTGSATTFVCTGFTRNYHTVAVLEAEKHTRELNPTMLDQLFVDFVRDCTSRYKAGYTYADSAEQILIRGLRSAVTRNGLKTQIRNAKKGEIINRIRLLTRLMGQDRFKVARHCKTVIESLSTQVWDPKQINKRLDNGTVDIDTADGVEYSIENNENRLMRHDYLK